eukprot:Skav229147  [mRNA]  locus=scaffold1875:242981:245351:+ [translate_table: standard]
MDVRWWENGMIRMENSMQMHAVAAFPTGPGWEDMKLDFLIAGFARSGTHSVREDCPGRIDVQLACPSSTDAGRTAADQKMSEGQDPKTSEDLKLITFSTCDIGFCLSLLMMELPQDMQAWLVLIARIALPIFILFVAFGPKIDAWLSSWGPVYSKKEMLRHWKVAQKSFKKDQKPSELSNLAMVTAETAPLLFQKPEVPERTSKQKKKSEKLDKSEKVERAEKVVEKSVIDKATEDLVTDKSTGHEATPDQVKPDEAAKQMHFESLMNFMAFNRHQPQRVFLPVGDPPPPRKAGPRRPTITGTDAMQANLEAQMVLQGALELELETPNKLLSGVARSLCDQLTRASVEIQAETFSLMVKACIKVMDLTSCSDFLCRIEAAGQVLDNTLMDHVMELYWDQKRRGPEPETEPANLAQDITGAYHGRPPAVHSMPEVFNQMAPGAWLSGAAHRDPPSPSFDLPAFSVPEEFKAIPDSGSTLSSEAPEFRPEGLGNKGSGLSPEAAEFQPGLLGGSTEPYTFKAKGHKISNKTLPKTSPPVDTLQ